LTGRAFTTIMAGIAIPDVIYDPTIGRFISADTVIPSMANPQCLNRYSYCLNNPLKYTDPSGHDAYQDYLKLCDEGQKLKEGKTIDVGAVTKILVINQPSTLAVPQAQVIVSGDGNRTVINIKVPGNDEFDSTLWRYTYNEGENNASSFGIYTHDSESIFYTGSFWRLTYTTESFNPNPLLFFIGINTSMLPAYAYTVGGLSYGALATNTLLKTSISVNKWIALASGAYSLSSSTSYWFHFSLNDWLINTGANIAAKGACKPNNPQMLFIPQ
jgi:hypothetical protein